MVVTVDWGSKVDTKIPIRVPFIECKGTASSWTTETEHEEDKTFRAFLEEIKSLTDFTQIGGTEKLKNLVETPIIDTHSVQSQLFSKNGEMEIIGKIPAENGIGYLGYNPKKNKKSPFAFFLVGQTPQGMRVKMKDESFRFPMLQDALNVRTLEEVKASLKVESAPKFSDASFPVIITPADQKPELKKEIEQLIARAKANQFADAFTPKSQEARNKSQATLTDAQKQSALDSSVKAGLAYSHFATVGPLVVTLQNPGMGDPVKFYYRDPAQGRLLGTTGGETQPKFFLRLLKGTK